MSLAFLKSPRQIIFIIDVLVNKKSRDQMETPSRCRTVSTKDATPVHAAQTPHPFFIFIIFNLA